MIQIILNVFFSLLLAAIVFLLIFYILRQLLAAFMQKRFMDYRKKAGEKIESFLDGNPDEFNRGLEEYIRETGEHNKKNRSIIDVYLTAALELPVTEKKRKHLTAIARRLDFLPECLAQIRSGDPEISAIGARRAGLYNFTETLDDMVAALDNLTSENQFEILMSLSRFGAADAMERAFAKIAKNIIVNERGIVEILSLFPDGESKIKLFRNMIQNDEDYISALFLKSMDSKMARTMSKDIIAVLHKGNKEVRAAAVRALYTLERRAPAQELIKALEDPDWEVRALAAKALKPVKKHEASIALFKALSDQQWWVRQNAANALANHPDYEVLFVLASELGDEYTKDSIISAIENDGSWPFLQSLKRLEA